MQPVQKTLVTHTKAGSFFCWPLAARFFLVGNAGKPIQENQTTHAIQSILISAKPFFSENTHTHIYIYIYITTLFVIVQIFIDSVIQIIIKIITATTAATKNYIKIITNIQKITLSAWKRAFFKTFFFQTNVLKNGMHRHGQKIQMR